MTVYADDVAKTPLKPIAYIITESENDYTCTPTNYDSVSTARH
jgi:hypothetical protein